MRLEHRVILLVEDDPDAVELTLRALRRNHIQNHVLVAKDGRDALEFLYWACWNLPDDLATTQPFVILLDLYLPEINGFQVLQGIRSDKRTADIPVAILTASEQDHDLLASFASGATAFIRKSGCFHRFTEELGLYWALLEESDHERKGKQTVAAVETDAGSKL